MLICPILLEFPFSPFFHFLNHFLLAVSNTRVPKRATLTHPFRWPPEQEDVQPRSIAALLYLGHHRLYL